MKLALLIHSALTNPEVRLALESGTLRVTNPGQFELEAATEVMRYSRNAIGPSGLFGGRGRGRGFIHNPDGWAWKEE